MTETWIVVCRELHTALGPFPNATLALEEAKKMSEKDACVYIPVPMAFRGELVVGHRDGTNQKEDTRPHPGQYL